MRTLCLVVLLASCAHEERIEGSGVLATPPAGWLDYCQRHEEEPTCNGQGERKS